MPLSEQEFTELVEGCRGKLVGIVSRHLRLQSYEAEDVVQKALLNAWEKRANCWLTGKAAEKWLIACAINHGLKHLRGQGRYEKRLEGATVLKSMKPSMF